MRSRMKLTHIETNHVAKSTALGALRRFDVRCENYLRGISYNIMVFAPTQSDAARVADQYIKDNGLVRAERMVTSA